eukprot:245583_1
MLDIQPISTIVSLTPEPLAVLSKIHNYDCVSPLEAVISPVASSTNSSLRARCKDTFSAYHQKQTFKSYNMNTIITILSKSCASRTSTEIDDLIDFFEGFQILSPEIDQYIAKDTFRNFIRETKYKFVNKNDFIFKKNESGDEFYFILNGEAEIFDDDKNEYITLNYGHIFGEPALFDNSTRQTYCKSIGRNGIDIAYWDKQTYNKYITPYEKIPIYKYKQYGRESSLLKEYNIGDIGAICQDENKEKNMSPLERMQANDIDAYNVWIAGCDPEDDSFAYFNTLYPILCEIFVEKTNCSKEYVSIQKDLEWRMIKYGGKKIKLSNIHYPDTRNYQLIVSMDTFNKFFKWFKLTFGIVKDLSFLCDLGCNLFISKENSETILKNQPKGTFLLRLSKHEGSVVLSYRTDKNYKKKYKHIEIIKKNNLYKVKKNKKNGAMSIPKMIRSFVRIEYLYTPKCLCLKKSIF